MQRFNKVLLQKLDKHGDLNQKFTKGFQQNLGLIRRLTDQGWSQQKIANLFGIKFLLETIPASPTFFNKTFYSNPLVLLKPAKLLQNPLLRRKSDVLDVSIFDSEQQKEFFLEQYLNETLINKFRPLILKFLWASENLGLVYINFLNNLDFKDIQIPTQDSILLLTSVEESISTFPTGKAAKFGDVNAISVEFPSVQDIQNDMLEYYFANDSGYLARILQSKLIHEIGHLIYMQNVYNFLNDLESKVQIDSLDFILSEVSAHMLQYIFEESDERVKSANVGTTHRIADFSKEAFYVNDYNYTYYNALLFIQSVENAFEKSLSIEIFCKFIKALALLGQKYNFRKISLNDPNYSNIVQDIIETMKTC